MLKKLKLNKKQSMYFYTHTINNKINMYLFINLL